MKNFDMDVNVQEQYKAALRTGDEQKFADLLAEREQAIMANIQADVQAAGMIDASNPAAMERFGLRALNKAEREYYMAVIETNSFSDTDLTFPRTIFDRVFEDLKTEHPLLAELQFVNTTGLTEWIFRTADVQPAWWGKLCDPIRKQLENGFKKESVGLYKLSAFIPMCKSMLVLAPEWLDRFVREMLMESIAMGLEEAAIVGTGADQPIGMTKDLAGAVIEGVYPDKEAVALTDLEPKTIGQKILAPLSKGKVRNITNIALIVNPADYWNIIYPMVTVRDQITGNYHTANMAFPFKVIQSTFVEEGTMIVGDLKNYFYGVGAPQKIEYSDDYHFLEDDRVYLAKVLANGRPLDNTSFAVFDISALGADEGAVTP